MNLLKYNYCYAKSFLKDTNSYYLRKFFGGEVYEASFYEDLIASENKYKIIAKGPYQKNYLKIKNGFNVDYNGRLIYYSNSLTRAEFDAIKINDTELYFYECTTATYNPGKLEKNISHKKYLLKELFPSRIIHCVVVSNNENFLNKFDTYKKFYAKPEINLLNIARNNKSQKINSMPSSLIQIEELNKEIKSFFDYNKKFEEISKEFYLNNNLQKSMNIIRNTHSTVERLYWGKIKINLLSTYLNKDCKNIKSKYLIVSINFKNINKPELRYYFSKNDIKKDFFDFEELKKHNILKSSKKELEFIFDYIPEKNIDDFMNLEEELNIFNS